MRNDATVKINAHIIEENADNDEWTNAVGRKFEEKRRRRVSVDNDEHRKKKTEIHSSAHWFEQSSLRKGLEGASLLANVSQAQKPA